MANPRKRRVRINYVGDSRTKFAVSGTRKKRIRGRSTVISIHAARVIAEYRFSRGIELERMKKNECWHWLFQQSYHKKRFFFNLFKYSFSLQNIFFPIMITIIYQSIFKNGQPDCLYFAKYPVLYMYKLYE